MALQTYISQIADLLLEKDLRSTKNNEVRKVARTLTLTLLNGERKKSVFLFLHEAELIIKGKVIVELRSANFLDANLSNLNLRGASVRGAYFH